MKKTGFIGGNFPMELKQAVDQYMNENGLTQTEVVLQAVRSFLDKDGDSMFTQEEYDLSLKGNAKFLEEIRAMVNEAVTSALPEPPTIEPVPAPNPNSVKDKGGLTGILPGIIAGELNCTILDAWETTGKASSKKDAVSFLYALAGNLSEKATEKYCKKEAKEYWETLPTDLVAILDPLVLDSLELVGAPPTKKDLFSMLAELVEDAAAKIYAQYNSVVLTFSAEENKVLNRLIEKEQGRFESPTEVVVYALGKYLQEKGDGGMWRETDKEMYELGKDFMERAEEGEIDFPIVEITTF